MKRSSEERLPPRLVRAMEKFGRDISIARRRRGVTTAMMAERLGVARATYQRIERGDPNVAFGTYMLGLFALGLGTPIADLADARTDETGALLAAEQLPQRVRPKREPQPK